MRNNQTLRSEWDSQGYVVVPQLFDAKRVGELSLVCNRILEQWIQESADLEAANRTNMAFLTELRYFRHHPNQLTTLLNAIVDQKIFAVLDQIAEVELLFHNTQYFFNPASQTRAGDWHRDQQFDAPDPAAERSRMQNTLGIHVHIAFLPDHNLEYVPGSHKRWDTPAELEIRKGLNGRLKNSSDMPNATRINLNAGDAVFFSAWGIHRGNYIAPVLRRTLDFICGTPADWSMPPPTCFLQPNVLQGLTPEGQRFFNRFIQTYRDRWLKGDFQS